MTTTAPATWPDLTAHGLSLWMVETRETTLAALFGIPRDINAGGLAALGLDVPFAGRDDLRVATVTRGPEGDFPRAPWKARSALATAFPWMRLVPFSHGLHRMSASAGQVGRMSPPDTSAMGPGTVSTWVAAVAAGTRSPEEIATGRVRISGRSHHVMVQKVDGDWRILLGNSTSSKDPEDDAFPKRSLMAVVTARAASAESALEAFAFGVRIMEERPGDSPWAEATGMAALAGFDAGRDLIRMERRGLEVALSRDVDGFRLEARSDVGVIPVGPSRDVEGLLRAVGRFTADGSDSMAEAALEAMLSNARELVGK